MSANNKISEQDALLVSILYFKGKVSSFLISQL